MSIKCFLFLNWAYLDIYSSYILLMEVFVMVNVLYCGGGEMKFHPVVFVDLMRASQLNYKLFYCE